MQKINSVSLVLILLVSLLLGSCSKDKHEDDIIGSWILTNIKTSNCANSFDNQEFDFEANNGCFDEDGEEVCLSGVMTISEDGGLIIALTATIQGFSETESMNYTITTNNDDSITLCYNGECEEGTCDISGDTITITTTSSNDCNNRIVGNRS